MRTLDLEALHIFRTVAEQGGITRAAAKLNRVQSNVTTRVKQLEERLGTRLFLRERGRLALSPEGREFVKMTSRTMMRILRQYSERFGIERLERLADELRALSAAVKGIE